MITIKDFMEVVNYRITEGSENFDDAYGKQPQYSISYWNEKHDGHSADIIFSTKTQEVFALSICNYADNVAYRWVAPEYRTAARKDILAWDEVNYTELEVEEDILAKTRDIINGVPYDKRIMVPIELPDDELFAIMKMAHERDITTNEFICNVLEDFILESNAKCNP